MTTQTPFALKWFGADRTNSVWYALAKLTMPKEDARVAAIRRRQREPAQALEVALGPPPSDDAVISAQGLDVDLDSPNTDEVETNLVDEEQDNHLASQEQPESSHCQVDAVPPSESVQSLIQPDQVPGRIISRSATPKPSRVDVGEGQDNIAGSLAGQVIQTNAKPPPLHLDRANNNDLLTEDSVRDFWKPYARCGHGLSSHISR